MKVLLVALALLALAASADSTLTTGGCGCQTPHLPPPPVTLPPPVHPLPPPVHPLPPPPPSCHYPTIQPPRPHPHPHPCQPGYPCVGIPSTPIVGQCIEFLRHQCSPQATPYCSPQCQALRQQCCQQIRHVEPLHRYQVIFGEVLQSIQQVQPGHPLAMLMASQTAQQLTAMCGLGQPISPCASCSS